ncbi:hypothetical protein HMPREF1146_2659 [Prevotella sp. MSX73]|nr:hypothetical protein HMPREF0649_00095 [Segatella buccae D17]EJP31030.1 hypothetical protein HMPREF1146_2659 [Prevotella sp. MSX73]
MEKPANNHFINNRLQNYKKNTHPMYLCFLFRTFATKSKR